MKVLVTGAAGTMGTACVLMVLRAGHEVRALVRDHAMCSNLDSDDRVDVCEADILDSDSVEAALDAVDAVIHCVDFRPRQYALHWDALRHGLKILGAGGQFIFPGNVWVYGPPESERINPQHPKATPSRLGELKADLEKVVLAEGGTVVHMPVVYGPGVTRGELAGLFERAIAGRAVRLPGNLDRSQEYLYIEDAARALISALGRPQAAGTDYTAPGRAPTTPREFFTLIYRAAGHPPRVGPVAPAWQRTLETVHPERRALRDLSYLHECSTLFDGGRIRRELGWTPEVSYEEGIRRTVQWMRRR